MIIYKTLENEIKIIEYEECYAASLAEMWNKSKDSWGSGDELYTEQNQIDIYRNGSYINVYLAVDGANVVGLCSLQPYSKDTSALHVHLLNVCPKYMSKKIGKELLLQSLKRTIELGYSRLELFTWPGNVKAIPLYKKCGFMWEDNSSSTHLSNYIPMIISQEFLKPYFTKIDWYSDSSRIIEVMPDSVSVDNFDFFTYEWQCDCQNLSVTIEKSGGRISCIETDDFIIRLSAPSHDLAYGFSYEASFSVINKTKKPLDVKVTGKNDGAISYDYANGTFNIDKPENNQDPERAHPCVLAHVTVNGMAVEMGIGINVKEPLTVKVDGIKGLAIPGRCANAFITINSSLLYPAKVELILPDNDLMRFEKSVLTFEIDKLGKLSVPISLETLAAGYVILEIPSRIKMSDEQDVTLNCSLSIFSQGLTERFPCITEKDYGIVNGPYHLHVNKNSNYAVVNHVLGYDLGLWFPVSKLGKPYSEEFDMASPIDVKTYEIDADIALSLTFKSEMRQDITMEQIYRLSSSGAVMRYHIVSNTGNTPTTVYLSEIVHTGIGHNATYKYDGRITMSGDAGDEGFGITDVTMFEENWVFENDPVLPIGVCWDPELKPTFRWDDGIVLEHELELAPGQSIQTPPVRAIAGIFKEYSAFRNYARQMSSDDIEPTEDLLEVTINSGNHFVYNDEFNLTIRNNRSKIYAGKVSVASLFFDTQEQTNPDDERVSENSFHLLPDNRKIDGGLGIIQIHMSFPSYLSNRSSAVFFPNKTVEYAMDSDILVVSNGLLTYKADPKHFCGLFSFKDSCGKEWLMSKHPKLEPFSWWNPFVGGMHNEHQKMNNASAAKENVTSEFTELHDCFGNLWQGIKSRVDVVQNKAYKGISYEKYHLTLPGVPILCSFSRYINNSGAYLTMKARENSFLCFGNEDDSRVAEITHKSKVQRFVLGSNEFESSCVEFAKITAENGMKLHWFANIRDRRLAAFADNDNLSFQMNRSVFLQYENGGERVIPPMFHVFSRKDLIGEQLKFFKRITFDVSD